MFNIIKFKNFLATDLGFNIGSAYKILTCSLIVLSVVITLYCLPLYPGNKLIYLIFSICYISTLPLLLFKEKFLFIDLFFAIYLWVGFWIKLTLYIYDTRKFLILNVGRFTFEIPKMDEVLLISIVCYLAFMGAIFIRKKFLPFAQNFKANIALENKLPLYADIRKYMIFIFVLVVLFLSYVNYEYSIYQRGVPFAELNFLILGAFKWLFQFGLASFALFIANEEFKLSKNLTLISLIILVEIFFTNISTLSRGAVISALPYLLCLFICFPRIKLTTFFLTAIIALFVFVSSASISNHLRHVIFASPKTVTTRVLIENSPKLEATSQVTDLATGLTIEESKPPASNFALMKHLDELSFPDLKIHIVDRIIGIEGIMALQNYSAKGWPLFYEALNETSASSGTSFYDTRILNSGYLLNTENFLFANLMGIFAFLYYPGSMIFIFFSFIIIYLLFSSIEYLSWRFGGRNVFFSCLVGHILAYRLVHFGYAPKQSYMLILTLIANIIIFNMLIKIFSKPIKNSAPNNV